MDKKQVKATFDSLRRSPKCKAVLERLLAGHSRPKIQVDLEMSEDALNQNLRQLYKKFHIWGDDERKLHRLIDLIRTSLPELIGDECEMPVAVKKRQDWGEAIVPVFFGRTDELTTLKQWILQDSCRLVALLGMGGIGKTALSVNLAQQIQDEFDYIIWRSLRNAPPIKEILADLIIFLSDQREINLPEAIEGRISLLIDYCCQHRCLLVLDNAEAILRGGNRAGYYREGYENYADLFQCVGETPSRSCLVLTSREKPREIDRLEGKTRPVRSLQLTGLKEEAQEILKEKGLFGSNEELRRLIEFYQGNPLALQIAPAIIKRLFNGNISLFIETGTAVFGDIYDLLEGQFSRLSPLEKEVMYWLAINRDPVLLTDLEEDIVSRVALRELIEALDSLGRRSLLEESETGFTQQPVVMEYMTDRLIEKVYEDIINWEMALFNSHALIKATAKDYVRDTQIRLILKPVVNKLFAEFGSAINIEYHMTQFLSTMRERNPRKVGYAGGNILNLLVQLKTDLSSYDFSHLTIWQAYLQDVNLHHINFAYSALAQCVFIKIFGSISTVVISPDGKLLATGDVVGEIHLWKVSDGQQVLTFKGHNNGVRSVAFSRQGTILASGSEDGTIKLWDVNTGQCLKTLPGHTNYWVWSVAFSSDGQTLISGSTDRTVKLWDVNSGQCFKILQGHTNWVWSVAFSPDDNTIASGSYDQTVRLWDVNSGQCFKTLQGHHNAIRSVAFSPDSNTLASGSDDQTVRLWDVNSGQCFKTLQGHHNAVRSVAFSPDNNTLASGSDDQTVRLWDVNSGQCFKTLQGYTNSIWSVAFSPDSNTLASGSNDKAVRLWDVNSGQCFKTLQGHHNAVRSVAFSPDNNTLASGSEDGTIKLWEVSTGQCLKTFHGHDNTVRSVAFSPDSNTLASGSDDQTVRLWDVNSGQCFKILEEHTSQVLSVAISPNGQIVASSGKDQLIKLWDIHNNSKCFKTLPGHVDSVRSVTFCTEGTILATGSTDKTIRLWNVSSTQCFAVLQEHTNSVRSIAFSPDGQTLVSCSTEKTVKLWNLNTGQCSKTMYGHSNSIWSVTFSSDGQTIASGSEDETIRLWNAKSGRCLKIFKAPRLYEGMNITEVTGLTEIQKLTLKSLGATISID